jgi:hypothetical protein
LFGRKRRKFFGVFEKFQNFPQNRKKATKTHHAETPAIPKFPSSCVHQQPNSASCSHGRSLEFLSGSPAIISLLSTKPYAPYPLNHRRRRLVKIQEKASMLGGEVEHLFAAKSDRLSNALERCGHISLKKRCVSRRS